MAKPSKGPEPIPLAARVRAERDRHALSRAIKAVQRAVEQSDNFDEGNMASHEIVSEINRALREEFSPK